MIKLDTILDEQINDIKRMLDKINAQSKSEKKKEEIYYIFQKMQNKLDKLIK